MTYGDPAWRDWVLTRSASRPFVERALSTASTSSTPPTCTPAASARRSSAARSATSPAARRGRDRDQGLLPDRRRPRTTRGLSRKHIRTPSTQPAPAAAPTTSTSTRSTASTRRRRSRRRSTRSTTWSGPARRATSARRPCSPGSSPRRCTLADRHGWARFVIDAEPLQPGLPRRGAGDDPALPRRRASASSRGARSPAASSPATGAARTAATRRAPRATTSRTSSTTTDSDFAVVERVIEVAGRRGVRRRAGGAGLAAPAAGRHRADHRRQQAGAPRGCRRSRRTDIVRRGVRRTGSALRAASRARA